MLGAHIEAIDLTDLWNLIQTRNKVHKHNIQVHGHGPSNSTTIDSNTSLMTTPTSPIKEHHVEMSQPEGSRMVTVKELLEDPPNTTQHDAICTKCYYIPFHSQQDNTVSWSDGPEVPQQLLVVSTPTSNDLSDINKELNTYKDRRALELNNSKKKKKQLETQNRVRLRSSV